MSRPLRIEYPGAWYHVMNRGVIFSEPRNPRFRPGIAEALAVCQREYRLPQGGFTGVRRGRGHEARDVLIYLCRHECGLPLKEIAQRLGIGAYTTVSIACARTDAKAENSPPFRRKLQKLAAHIRQPTIVT
jgi:hypothetical protein